MFSRAQLKIQQGQSVLTGSVGSNQSGSHEQSWVNYFSVSMKMNFYYSFWGERCCKPVMTFPCCHITTHKLSFLL